jgi:hypothetical protein
MRALLVALAAVALFAAAAYGLGRSIKAASEPAAPSIPVRIVGEDTTVRPPGRGPSIPALRLARKPRSTAPRRTTTTGSPPAETATSPTAAPPASSSPGPTGPPSGTGSPRPTPTTESGTTSSTTTTG